MNDSQRIYAVRAEFGKYAQAFVAGGYIGIGWLGEDDLSDARAKGREYIAEIYDRYEPDASPNRKGQNVGQIWRF